MVQAAWALLLNRYTGQQTVIFGATVAGRPADLPEAERLLGLFINTLPVVATLKPEQETGAWLRDLQAQNLALREHEHTPLYEIQRWMGQSGQGLFDSILVFENYPIDKALQQSGMGGLVFSEVRNRETSNYPMMVSVMRSDVLCLHYGYACAHFSKAAVDSIAARMNRLLHEITRSATRQLGDIDLLSEAERAQLDAWGVNAQRYADAEPVHRLIERRVEACPDAVALIFGDTELSYAELNRRANRLAHRLIALGVKPETKVGIAVERSSEMIVGLLAILKTGGAYVPLDPAYPRERLHYMVTDSAMGMLLTQSHIRARIPCSPECTVLELDTLDVSGEAAGNPEVSPHGDNLAYVIYTSGSTGKPKGVALPHHALAEHAQGAIGLFGLSAADRMLLFSTINFDSFIDQFFPPLCAGAAIVLSGPQLWDSDTFYRELIDQRITVADLTTAYWFLLAQDFARQGPRDYGVLRQVHAGGEAMSPEGIKAWREAGLGGITLLNLYGPTEATVTATALDCGSYSSDDSMPMQVTIGSPLAGRNIYLLDANLTPVSPGIPGELCIGGDLLARAYLHRGGLTAERFVADPFDEKGGRLYRTGDLARWRADGQIEYLGRLDHQVKIRGFRIELGEIEAQLLLQPAIREAVVVAGEGPGVPSGARLVAYVSLHGGIGVDHATLREALGKALPDYMIPSAIVVLDSLPLNPNGKLDRKALPEPEFANVDHYEAPRGEVEEVLAGIWAEVLGVGQVGRNDNFFELGGDSILCLQIVIKARRAGWKITPRQLFERQTIAVLAKMAETMQEPVVAAAEPERGYLHDYLNVEAIAALPFGANEIEDIYPLAPIQEGMLFHTLEAPGNGLYVTQLSVAVEGLEPQRLVDAWRAMVARHAVLRTGFLWQAGLARPLQIVFKQADTPVVQLDWRGLDGLESRLAAYADEDLKREFDFLNPPVARLSLIRIAGDRYQLVWTKHHILLDGWGDSLLISDWLRCYAGETLTAPGPGYGHYVHWLAQQDAEATQAFWKNELERVEGATLLSNAHRMAGNADNAGKRTGYAQIYTHLSVEETSRLQEFVQRERVTFNTLVQAAWGLLLQRYTGKDTVVFGVTVAGRSPNLPKADEILGLFINTIPVPVARRSDLTVSEHLAMLQSVNARLREHEHTALADIQRWAGSPGQPLFDSIVVFEKYPIAETLRGNEGFGLHFGAIEGK
ncbi:MAG: amino acid adenylation domain-containing protein, partial [Salinisphaera sp.]|nr:amino acid adenylation domain-containing protein [Salinisphaera sp.]